MTTRITHIGGPTALIEVDGWRLLTDPTFDPPGRRYTFGWGSSSRKLTGPVRYSMTAREAIQLCQLVRPQTAIPVHYEGWTHFHQDRPAIEREFARAPADISRSIRWLPIGEATTVAA
jgi:L-ascorbate metabolism protein UlaG (beta-lactamase superfamily)